MTPYQEAVSLVEKYYDATYKDGMVFDFRITLFRHQELTKKARKGYDSIERAKACAIIAVDLVIKVLDEISLGESGTTKIDYGQSHFQEVKNEINKL